MAGQGRIRVFLLDDHDVVRAGLERLVTASADMVVVGEARTGREAIRRVPRCRPNVAVLDVRLPDQDGIAVCRTLRSANPGVNCLMLTSYADEEALAAAVMAGAAGYLVKRVRPAELLAAIRQVATGASLFHQEDLERVKRRFHGAAGARPAGMELLTDQERNVLALISEGLSNRQIAERIHLSEKTVRNYVSSLLGKLGMQRRTQAAVLAMRLRENPDAFPRADRGT